MSRIPLTRSRAEGNLAQLLCVLLLLIRLLLHTRQRLCSSGCCASPCYRHPNLHTHTWTVCCEDACELWACLCSLPRQCWPRDCPSASALSHAKQRSAGADGAGAARQDAVSQHQVCLLQHMRQLAPRSCDAHPMPRGQMGSRPSTAPRCMRLPCPLPCTCLPACLSCCLGPACWPAASNDASL